MLIMEEEGSEQRLIKSSVAANKLGISKASLNRMAPIYEQVHGELPRGGRHVRLWTLEAIERIRSARLAFEERRAETIEAALRGFETPEDAQSSQMPARISEGTPETRASPRTLEELAEEMHALREVVEDQNTLLNTLVYTLLSVEIPRLERFEAGSPLPVSTADTSDEEDARQTSRDRRVLTWIFLIMLLIPPIVIAVMSVLSMDILLLMASLALVAIVLLIIWYYYYVGW
jgi:hypothetical protein